MDVCFFLNPDSVLDDIDGSDEDNNAVFVRYTAPVDESEMVLYIGFNLFHTRDPPPIKDTFQQVTADLKNNEVFINGMRLKNIEPKQRFPIMDYAVFGREKSHSGNVFVPQKLDRPRYGSLDHHVEKIYNTAIGFEEYDTLWPNGEPTNVWDRRPAAKDTVFLTSIFRADGDLRRLEQSWRSWSGAQFILGVIPTELKEKLRRMTFHRGAPGSRGNFMYVLICEFAGVTSLMYLVRGLTYTLNERHCGFTSAFMLENEAVL